MLFELMVAANKDGIISINDKLPWHIPEDLARFKRMTEGNIVIMGRKTFESLPTNQRPLKNRMNIVLTREPANYKNEMEQFGANLLFTTMEELFSLAIIKNSQTKKIFIIGGSEIYHLLLPYCGIVHFTRVYSNKEFYAYNNNDVCFFPYSVAYLLAHGFSKNRRLNDNNEEEFIYSKNPNIKFKYITLYKDPHF
jgi:dihydrofolate reductase